MPDSESSCDCAVVVAALALLTADWTLDVPGMEGAVAVSGEVETPDVVGAERPAVAVAEWWSEYTMATAATRMHPSTTVAAMTRLRSLGPAPLPVLR